MSWEVAGLTTRRPAPTAVPVEAPRRYCPPELRIAWRGNIGDIWAWDLDCEGGDWRSEVEPAYMVSLYVNRETGRMDTALWHCKRNHLGCRMWRWEKDEYWLRKRITVPELYLAVFDGAEWTRANNRRRNLTTSGTASEDMWVLLDNGLRLTACDVDITPKGGPRMRLEPSGEVIDKFGRWHVKESAVRREYSNGWRPPTESSNDVIAVGGRDRIAWARKKVGLVGGRLPSEMTNDEAAWRMDRELGRER